MWWSGKLFENFYHNGNGRYEGVKRKKKALAVRLDIKSEYNREIVRLTKTESTSQLFHL